MKSFLTFLEKNPEIRKIFGKRELKIIEKQAWAVGLTQSEKNRLSRDIRKKLDAVKGLSSFSEEFRLKKGAALKEQIDQVLETLQKEAGFKHVLRVWLFGSSVEGKRALSSDVDFAVEFTRIEPPEALSFRKRVLGGLDEKIDVQVYNFLPQAVKAEIRKGTVIYERADAAESRGH